jgi:hypothetical protein
MRFDWYQPTIPERPMVIVEELLARLAPGGEVVEGRGRHNYHQAFEILNRDRDRVAVVLCGGPNGDPNVTASGAACDEFVPVVRELWPAHRVTRADVAEDFAAKGVYEGLEASCRAVAGEAGVKGRAIVPDDPADGRTYYMGAPTSDVRVRLYDKTAESRRHLPEKRHAEVPDHWARLEVQVRLRKDWKSAAAFMEPDGFWGFARWTSQLAAMALKRDVERLKMNPARETDYDRAYRALLEQYARTFARLLQDHGSPAAVGAQIYDDLRAMGRRR